MSRLPLKHTHIDYNPYILTDDERSGYIEALSKLNELRFKVEAMEEQIRVLSNENKSLRDELSYYHPRNKI